MTQPKEKTSFWTYLLISGTITFIVSFFIYTSFMLPSSTTQTFYLGDTMHDDLFANNHLIFRGVNNNTITIQSVGSDKYTYNFPIEPNQIIHIHSDPYKIVSYTSDSITLEVLPD